MPTRSSKLHRPKDLNLLARQIVEESIGERLDGSPLSNKDAGKNPNAVALGKLGGAKGGTARAAALSAERRVEIARAAAAKRWGGLK
ncbi:MAG: hypothetical protein ABJA67_15010 [Chthonomonadales bacterium]